MENALINIFVFGFVLLGWCIFAELTVAAVIGAAMGIFVFDLIKAIKEKNND